MNKIFNDDSHARYVYEVSHLVYIHVTYVKQFVESNRIYPHIKNLKGVPKCILEKAAGLHRPSSLPIFRALRKMTYEAYRDLSFRRRKLSLCVKIVSIL